VLSRQILLELLHQKFVEDGLELTEDDLELAREQVNEQVGGADVFEAFPRSYRETLVRRSAEVNKLQATLGDVKTDDAAVKRFYDENPEFFRVTCTSHILVNTKEQADAVRAELAGGGDFAALAAQHSIDTSNKDDGGDLDCNPPGRFVPAFEQAVEDATIDEVTEPVQTTFGWHLILVRERRVEALEDVAPQIRQELLAQSGQAFTAFLAEAADKAKITVNPRYGRYDKTQLPGAVVPPQSPSTSQLPGPPDGLPGEQP
jgi:foldase protein PrsA